VTGHGISAQPGIRSPARRVLALVLALALSAWAASFSIDFSVYHPIARYLFREHGALYGPESGLPWPMWYRYPPLFLFVFFPLWWLPFRLAAFVWALGKCLVAALLVRTAWSRTGWPAPQGILVAACLGLPYLLNELRYGNAQFYVFALVATSLVLVNQRPVLSAALLGLGIGLKIWPLFFIPYLWAAGCRWVAARALGFAFWWSLLPGLYFGWEDYVGRLARWWDQERGILAGVHQIWFPSQSLLGWLTRFLSRVDYSQLPDPGYPDVHLAVLPPGAVTAAWLAVSAGAYGWLLWIGHKHRPRLPAQTDAVAFCLLVLLQPYAQKQTSLVVLWWPALVAGALWANSSVLARRLFTGAALLALAGVLAGHATRWLLVLGTDTLGVVLLAAGLAARLSSERRKEGPASSAGED